MTAAAQTPSGSVNCQNTPVATCCDRSNLISRAAILSQIPTITTLTSLQAQRQESNNQEGIDIKTSVNEMRIHA